MIILQKPATFVDFVWFFIKGDGISMDSSTIRILNALPDNIYVFDTAKKEFIYVNDRFARVFNSDKNFFLNKNITFFQEKIYPEDLQSLKDLQRKAPYKKDGESESFEARFRIGQEWHWLRLEESVFLRDSAGAALLIIGIVSDISTSKFISSELSNCRNFINNVLATTPGNIFIMDIEKNKVLFDSMNVLKTLGYTPEQMIGFGEKFFPELLHPDDIERVLAIFEKVRQQKTDDITFYETRFRHVDGSWRWFSTNLKPSKRDSEGKVVEVSGVAVEITEKKETELKLRETQEFIDKVLSAIPGDIFVDDLIENKVLFSTNSFQTLGYSPEEIIQMGEEFLPKLVHPDDLQILIDSNKILQKQKEDKIIVQEIRFRHINGQWLWFSIVHKPFKRNKEGEVIQAVGVVIDITEKKDAEFKLRESQEFIDKVLSTIPGDIYVSDLIVKGIIFSTNSFETLGYTREEIERRGPQFIISLLHPEDLPLILESNKRIAESPEDKVLTVEARYRHTNGQWRWFSIRQRPFKKDKEGKVFQLVGVVTDITERKDAEFKLRESEKFVVKITDTSPNIIMIFDIVNQRPIYVNKAIKDFLGFSPEEYLQLGEKFLDLIHPEDQPRIIAHFEYHMKSKKEEVLTTELRVRDKSGNWRWHLIRDTIFDRDEEGKIIQTIAVGTDITDRKRMEEEIITLNRTLEERVAERTRKLQKSEENLRQSENQLRLITNAIPALVSYIDQKETYRFANPFYQNLSTVTGNITGKQVKGVLTPEEYNVARGNLNKALSGEMISFENRLPMKDGSVRILNINFIPDKDELGRTRGIVVLGIDMTDRIEYQKNLEKKNIELSRTNADLDNFIYTASHDLKAPISNLEGLLISIMDEIKRQGNEEIITMMDMMMTSIKRLRNTIRDLTEISKIQRNHEDNRELIDINAMIEEFKNEFAVQIKNSKASIITQLEINNILFSRKNFRSIIYNLFDNAIKYRSPDRAPRIIVQTERIENEYVLLSVKDNGLGFDISKKDKVFEMFRRMHPGIEGTGIGLYIIKRIVENAGGKVDVESEENVGSVFKIYFKIGKR